MLKEKNMVSKLLDDEISVSVSEEGEKGEESRMIKIWAWGPYIKAAEYAIQIYSQTSNGEIEFSMVEIPSFGEMKDMIISNANTEDLPDIIIVDDNTLKYYAREKPELFVTFNDYLDVEKYMSFRIAGVTCEDGLIYGVPYSSDTVALYYRTDILGELNDNLTWEEFIDIGMSMKANFPNMYLLPLTKQLPQILIQSSGMSYYDEEGNFIFENYYNEGREVLNQTTEMLYRLYWDGELMYYLTSDDELEYFIQEIPIAAFIGEAKGFSVLKRLQEEGSDIGEWKIARLPKSETFSKDVSLGGCSWMVLNKETQYDENGENIAIDFVMRTFGAYPGLAKRMAKEYDVVPVLKAAIPQNMTYDNRIPWYKQNMALYMGSFGEDIATINLDNHTTEIGKLYQEHLFEGIENQKTTEEVSEDFINDASASYGEAGFGLYEPTEPSGELESYELDLPDWWEDPDIIKELERIELTREPERMKYLQNEKFDTDGMAVTAYYKDGSFKRISNYYLNIVPESFESIGNSVKVDIYYEEEGITKNTTIEVKVIERRLNSLVVVREPYRKLYVFDESFDTSGMAVKAVYEGGIEREVPLDKLEVPDPSMSTTGTKDVEICYSDGTKASVWVRVEIVERNLSGLRLACSPNKNSYVDGEIFDPQGMKIEAQYSGQVWLQIVDYYYKNTAGTKTNNLPSLTIEDNKVEVYYEENEEEKSIEVPVTVLCKESANEKIKQTKLNYECGAGQAAVNVYTGGLEFERSDIGIGVNDYQVGISHIYNDKGFALPQGMNTCMGNGWKLNVQQYLYEYKDKYLYIDGGGVTHTFEKLGDGRYYDTSGLGLILTPLTYEKIVSDPQGNKMYFSGNVLVKTESCHNSKAVKIYNYDAEGRLTKVYDGRKTENKLELAYNLNGLLKTIECKQDNESKKSIHFYYDSDQNLSRIEEKGGTERKEETEYEYSEGRLKYAVEKEGKSALRFKYDDSGRIGEVDTGIAEKTEGIEISPGMETYEMDIKSKNTFDYQRTLANYTEVTNEKGIKVLYFFNEQGITTSILEANEGDAEDLRTIEKQAGVEMSGGGTDSEKINNKKVWKMLNKPSISSGDEIMSSVFEGVKSYRKSKCPDYENYVCSFWLKLGRKGGTEVKLTVKSSETEISTDEGGATIDNTAVNSWQWVQIPIKISSREILSIKLEFSEMTNYKIGDMRLGYAPSVQYRIGNREGLNAPLDEITEIRFQTAANTDFIKKEVTPECYISEKDIQATYLSAYGGKDYILSLCDGTIKYKVCNVKLYQAKSNKEFILGLEETNNRAQLYQETKSPDGSVSVFGELYFKSDRVEERTVAEKENIRTETRTEADYKGKIVKEVDEYGVTTEYEYDENGNQTKKTISHQETPEKLVFETSRNSETRTESSETSYTRTKYDGLFGTASEVSYRGKRESDENFLTTTFGYNVYKDRLTSVENNAGGKNVLRYDEKGRLKEVTATGLETAGGYGYGFEYNAFGEPIKHSLIYGEAESAKQLLTEKEIDYAAGTLKDKKYRNAGSADETKVTLDKYGRTSKIEEKSFGESYKTTSFTRQELNESEGASEVVETYDPYEDRRYTYSYDDRNNLTGYEVKEGPTGANGDTVLSIKKTNENRVTYGLKSKIVEDSSEITYDFGYISEITYDEDKLLTPRITKTVCQLHAEMEDGNTEYSYDVLGRMKSKKQKIYHKTSYESEVSSEVEYKFGTTLKSKITTKMSRNLSYVNTYEYSNTYNDRGMLVERKYTRGGAEGEGIETQQTYTYDKANRLATENNGNGIVAYSYTADGSIEKEEKGNVTKQYVYEKGRLVAMKNDNAIVARFAYDNLGNCTHYKRSETESANMEWERGSLLKSYANTTYSYNSQGIRYKKVVGGREVAYCLDGGKLLLEKRGNKQMSFAYDEEGVIGFYYYDDTPGEAVKKFGTYTYVKDEQGNVVAILDKEKEVGRYSYDAWGKCTVEKDVDGIGELNPIRWKSQYYDEESGFYYIEGRYYSPEIRRYISAENPETAQTNAGTLYGLNLYLLSLTNPVGMVYNGYTIETNAEMSYDPDELTNWQEFVRSWKVFWNSPFGKYLSIQLFVAATALAVICPAFAPMYASAVIGVGISLGVGAAIAGYRSLRQGNGFWEGFANHVNENWAQEVAIGMALAMVSFGVSQASQAIRSAGANKKLANSTTACDPKCFKAGTQVLCLDENGEECHKPIEEIEVGDMVWSYDEETGESDWKPVVRLFRNETKEWYHVFVEGEEIICTGGHPFYVVGKGFVEARSLKTFDKLLLSSGEYGIIEKVEAEQLTEFETTYNFEVADFHTYYVTEKAVLVHNLCKNDIYNSVKDSPDYNPDFIPEQKTIYDQVKRRDLADDLQRIDPGRWRKAYQNGYIEGQQYSLHYFKNLKNGNVFNIKYKSGWVVKK